MDSVGQEVALSHELQDKLFVHLLPRPVQRGARLDRSSKTDLQL